MSDLSCIFRDPNELTLATLQPNDWETDFFGRLMGGLQVETRAALLLPTADWQAITQEVSRAADERSFAMVQCHLDVRALPLIPALENVGFRLVDTRITFVTRMDRRDVQHFEPPFGELDHAREEDLPALLALTHQGFTNNPRFFSRYKERAWFTEQDSERWFAAWIENHLTDTASLFGIWRMDGEAVSYFLYSRKNDLEGLPFYKGMLTTVDPAIQGHKAHLFLQSWLYDQMPSDEFWLDNTTQLTNTPILRNHVISKKRLEHIDLTFFRKGRS